MLNDEPGSTKAKVIALYALLIVSIWRHGAGHSSPSIASSAAGTAFLAYSLGCAMPSDADHIAAIDNVTRKLMQQGKRPVAVGLMFSLGHSTIVIVGSIAIAGARSHCSIASMACARLAA